ncbi:hypothetical protein [Paracoccus sp. (in: a-proteobacteria)]|uniref:hypothetical protein n=1 Tax=Paracoccus sp. TaxID=267 RepID=UPI00289EC37E|nr:hypothetical protein [Paracoccus sp. (in: a-proteobacteria)]
MTDTKIITSLMKNVLEAHGGLDAAAAYLSEKFGKEVHKGTLSKRQAGDLEWPLAHIWALEDAVECHSVSRYRNRILPEAGKGESMMSAAASLMEEAGEAFGAIAKFATGKGSIDEARKETSDMRDALDVVTAVLDREAE